MSTIYPPSIQGDLPARLLRQDEETSQWPIQDDVSLPFESLSDSQAGRIVRHSYEMAANYRYQNHDWRWTIADTLYTGFKPVRYWDGTRIPMSHLAVMLAFEQIESWLPRVEQAIFGDGDWFDAEPLRGTTPKIAREARDIIAAQLEPDNPWWQIRQIAKSIATYGNGIATTGFEYRNEKLLQFIPQFEPIMKMTLDPFNGQWIEMPTGKFKRTITETEIEEEIQRPYFRYIPLKFFYIDPNCPSGDANAGQYVIYEFPMSVEELDRLGDEPGFEYMPDLHTLQILSQDKPTTQADWTMQSQEASRRVDWSPNVDQSADPAHARIKVQLYTSKHRIIWMLNQRFVVYNEANPLGKINYYNGFYADLLDRFYAMGICDVIESEQRVQEGLLNARMNELSLAIHPTTVRQRNSATPVYQLRVRPGNIADSADPKNDVIRQYPMNATANSHLESQASDLRAQKRTGIDNVSMMGVGGTTNPAMRTATGAGLQGQASHTRNQGSVEIIERMIIEPAITDVFEWDKRFLDPNKMIETLDGREIDPVQIYGANVKFKVRASSRMQSKQAVLTMAPFMMQSMMNPALLSELMAQGKTIDFVDMMNAIMSAAGFNKKWTWIRPMTPQEQQAIQAQKQQSPDVIKMQMQDKRMSALSDMQVNKQEMEMLRSFLDHMMEDKFGANEARRQLTSDNNADRNDRRRPGLGKGGF